MFFLPVTLAFAEEAAAPAAQSPYSGIISMAPLIILFVIFYFLLIRPQQKKAKEQKALIAAIQKGDSVITTAGIHGKVASVSDDTILVEVADNVKIKFSKEAVAVRKSQG